MKIVIIQGHPDSSQTHFDHALAAAYQRGAESAGHQVEIIDVAAIDFPLLRSYDEFYKQDPPAVILPCQEQIRHADHLVIIYPLWMGSMPALLKGFLEQLFRPGFAMRMLDEGKHWEKLLKGKSARVIVTMGMPALVYRWLFRAHSLKSLEQNILKFTGISPVRKSLIGTVEGSAKHRDRWIRKITGLGKAGN